MQRKRNKYSNGDSFLMTAQIHVLNDKINIFMQAMLDYVHKNEEDFF